MPSWASSFASMRSKCAVPLHGLQYPAALNIQHVEPLGQCGYVIQRTGPPTPCAFRGARCCARAPRSFARLTEAHPALAHVASSLVSAPLVAHDGALWAASPQRGEVFEAAP